MTFIFGTRSNFHEVINIVGQYIPQLPPNAHRRLRAWLLLERLLRKPARPPAGKQLSAPVRQLIENQVSLFTGYMVLFAHDDAVDQYSLETTQIYEQLSRCLAAFVMKISLSDESATAGMLRDTMNQWSDRMQTILHPFPHILADLPHLFKNPSLLLGNADEEPVMIESLFLRDGYEPVCRDWLNMTIVSAMGMGGAFRTISKLIKQHLAEDEITLQRRSEFLVAILVKCMYAQAHSPEQRKLETLRYERWVELAYLKSTILLDIRNYVSDQVNEERYFATRHNTSRACDQIFDDLQDFEEDTRDGVLGILHMQIVEQGRLAEKFLALSEKRSVSMTVVQQLLRDTIILCRTYDQAFIYQNPYIEAPRDDQGNLLLESAEAETILREIWVNAPHELDWPVEALARHRFALYESFKLAWQEGNHAAVLDVIYRSNFPLALLQALHRFVNQSKRVIIESHKQYGAPVAGYVSYTIVSSGIKFLWLDIWKRRNLRPKSIVR